MTKRVYRPKELPLAVRIQIAAEHVVQNERVVANAERVLETLRRHPETAGQIGAPLSIEQGEHNLSAYRRYLAEARDKFAALQALQTEEN